MSKSAIHEKNVLPDGDWTVARGKKNTDELFVQARNSGTRLCRMWDGIVGRDATARLFASSKRLLKAAEEILEIVESYEGDPDPEEAKAIERLKTAICLAKGG